MLDLEESKSNYGENGTKWSLFQVDIVFKIYMFEKYQNSYLSISLWYTLLSPASSILQQLQISLNDAANTRSPSRLQFNLWPCPVFQFQGRVMVDEYGLKASLQECGTVTKLATKPTYETKRNETQYLLPKASRKRNRKQSCIRLSTQLSKIF